MPSKKIYKHEMPLDGKLITSVDPAKIGTNYQQLVNMRYSPSGMPKGIGGMTKITSSQIDSTYYKVRSGIHYTKDQPSESHVLVEAYNSALSASRILQNTTAIPSAGNFSATSLYTPSGSSAGRWSLAPDGDVAYCNGEESCVWGGTEREVGGFICYDPSGTFLYDYTERVRNTINDAQNNAVLNSVSGGIDSNTMLMLHLDNNVTDSSPTTPHNCINRNVTFTATNKVFGTHWGVFTTNAYISIPDNADFDLSDGTFTIDCHVRVDDLSSNYSIYYHSEGEEGTPSASPSGSASTSPSGSPSEGTPSTSPSGSPSSSPSGSPSGSPSATNTPSNSPSGSPSGSPSEGTPSASPSSSPSGSPSGSPSEGTPSASPSGSPSGSPSASPSEGTPDDDNSFNVMITTTGQVLVRIKSGGTKQFSGATDFATAAGVISAGTTYHIAVVESGNNWYIFVDGTLRAYTSDTARATNYIGFVLIGYDGTTYLEGKIDEYRVSNLARWTSAFEVPTEAYSTSATTVSFYIGAVRPLDGFKLYVDTANTSASTMSVFYWDGSSWTGVSSLTDNTDTGASLAVTGTVTFTSTVSTAKLKYINGAYIYWYKVVVDAVDTGVDIYYATVSAPFQPVKDIWDGIPYYINSFQIYNGGYQENTLNVRENIYVSTDSGTYSELDGLESGGTDYLVLGFSGRSSGIYVNFVAGKGNTTAGTVLSVYYWNGTTWASVGSVDDGTIDGGKSLAKSGAITWNPPSAELEFTTQVNNAGYLYYYKITFSQTLSSDVQVYHINGIPAQKSLSAYKFPFFANDRMLLCSDQKEKKNSILVGAAGSSSIFNGDDSIEYAFGDEKELVGAAWLYSQYGSSIFNVILFFKANETWALVGNGPDDWVKYRVSSTIGCIDPESIKVIDMPPQATQTLNRNIVQFRGADGIYMSDGRSPIKLSDDIDDKFDKRKTTTVINNSVASCATYDISNNCYHWMCAAGSATTLDEEWVLDLEKPGWFQINRTTNKKLQYAIEVKDTNGATYNYGFTDQGYMYRLDYGNTFDGEDIAHTLHTGDMILAQGSLPVETDAEYFCLIAVAKTNTANSITFTHYGDCSTTGTSWTESPQKSGFRTTYPVEHQKLGAHIFHSVKMTISTDDETTGFEPLYFYILYSPVRDHIRDWRE